VRRLIVAIRTAAIGCLFVVSLLGAARPARAAVFNVNTTLDFVDPDLTDGQCGASMIGGRLCSLRAAIQQANAMPGESHQINLPAGRYDLTVPGADEDAAAAGDLDIVAEVTIVGAGVPNGLCIPRIDPFIPGVPTPGGCTALPAGVPGTVIDGRGIDRVFDVISGPVHINDLAIVGGQPPMRPDGSAGNGGGIRNSSVLDLTNVALDHNRADGGGGGIRNTALGRLIMANSSVTNNVGQCGGGVWNVGWAALMGSFIAANTALIGGGVCTQSSLSTGEIPFFLRDSTIADNQADFGGGMILAETGSTTQGNVRTTTFVGNTARSAGGGIYVVRQADAERFVSFDLVDSFVVNNTADGSDPGDGRLRAGEGGGIAGTGNVGGEHVVIRGNTAQRGSGGGMHMSGAGGVFPVVVLRASEISLNRAARDGGGIHLENGTLDLLNTTISLNLARDAGGGVRMIFGTLFGDRLTIADNRAGTGAAALDTEDSSMPLSLTIVARSSGLPNCRSVRPIRTFGGTGFNLEDRNDCGFTGTGDLVMVDPMLGPLRDNGGRSWTQSLAIGSPALDVVPPADPPAFPPFCDVDPHGLRTDQRDVARPQPHGGNCDAGAYERITFTAIWMIPCCHDHLITVLSLAAAVAQSASTFEAQMIAAKDQQGTALAGQIVAGIATVRGTLEAVGASKDPAGGLAVLDKASGLLAALRKQVDTAGVCCSSGPDARVAQFTLAKDVERLRASVDALAKSTRRQLALDMLDGLLQKVRGLAAAGKSLEAALQAAQSSLLDGRDGPAMQQLDAFVRHVGALSGKSLDRKTASALADIAREIQTLAGGG
jgi:CSLREA domain-containing protein